MEHILTTKEFKEFNIRDPLFRQALWESHNKTCAYSGEPIRFAELQVEHIIPQRIFAHPDQLSPLLKELGLPANFHVDQPENLLPTLGFANRQKSDKIELLQLRHALSTAQSKLQVLKKSYRRIQSEDDINKARLRLFYGVSIGEISIEKIKGLLNELTIGNTSGLLNLPLIFADSEIVDISAISDPITLLDKAICPRRWGLSYLTLINDSKNEISVVNCHGWLDGLSRGYYAKTNYDIKESAFFKAVASLVWALKFRKPPLESYFLEGLIDMKRMPPFMLPHLSGDEARALEKLGNKGESVESILRAEGIDTYKDEFEIQFIYKNMETSILEVLRGDFTGDGHEDLLISKYERVIDGTLTSYENLIISTRDHYSKFQVVNLSESDFIKLLKNDV